MRARQAMLHESAAPPLASSARTGGARRLLVHVGIVSIFVGIAASSAFRVEAQQTLKAGRDGRRKVPPRYGDRHSNEDSHVSRLSAVVSVWRDGRQIATLLPEKRFYKKPKQPTTEVAMRSTLTEDLYLVLGSYDGPSGLATIQAYVNPLVAWLWIGGFIMGFGTLVTMWPSAAERRAVAVELGAAPAAAD
jgi:cytochrome c-type biogenesis protein CcmF